MAVSGSPPWLSARPDPVLACGPQSRSPALSGPYSLTVDDGIASVHHGRRQWIRALIPYSTSRPDANRRRPSLRDRRPRRSQAPLERGASNLGRVAGHRTDLIAAGPRYRSGARTPAGHITPFRGQRVVQRLLERPSVLVQAPIRRHRWRAPGPECHAHRVGARRSTRRNRARRVPARRVRSHGRARHGPRAPSAPPITHRIRSGSRR
jgi:hypothetical protein